MLAGDGRLNRHQRVRMIRNRDDHRINFRRRQHIAIIVKSLHRHAGFALVGVKILRQFLAGGETLGIQIADRHHARQRLGHGVSQVAAPHAATADLGDLYFLAWRVRTQQPRGQNGWQAG